MKDNKQITFSDVKVYNEIALCKIEDQEIRMAIERLLLKNRISFFEKWVSPGFFQGLFGNHRETCYLCVNEAQVKLAEELVTEFQNENKIELVLERVNKIYF